MEGIDIDGDGPGLLVARVGGDRVQDGIEFEVTEASQVAEENCDRDLSRFAERKGEEYFFVERGEIVVEREMPDDIAEVPCERARPAECVNSVAERS